MGAAQGCSTAGCRSARAADRYLEDEGNDEVGFITEEPHVLVQVVRSSFAKIPTEKAPPQPGSEDSLLGKIPYTLEEMFNFNKSVMTKPDVDPDLSWSSEVLPHFGKLVNHLEDSQAFKAECQKLSAKIENQGVTLEATMHFRNVLFASLRSLLPLDWSAQHEVAWGWFWDRVSKQLRVNTEVLKSLVQSSWALIPGERSPENTSMIPVTFAEMATFNAMVLAAAAGKAPPTDPAKHYSSVMFPGLTSLVEGLKDSTKMEQTCTKLGSQLKEMGASPDEITVEFKTTMLASLRSLLPKDWTPQHEVAWAWFHDSFSKKIAAQLAPSSK